MSDLTAEEQAHVRAALRFLRTRFGGWERLGQALHITARTLAYISEGNAPSAGLAFRLARLAGVPVDDVATGKYPPAGTCPYCGHMAPDSPAQ